MPPGDARVPPVHTDAVYLENLSRKIFISGFANEPVRQRWPRFQEVFYGFDPGMVAEMPGLLVDEVCEDTALIRNRPKIRAVVENARVFVSLAAEHGSFHAYLRSLDGLSYAARSRDVSARFRRVGPNTAYYFLMDAGEPVPAHKPPGVR